jgi:hypothetical protein
VFAVDGLGLHRITRRAILELQERVTQLEALVGLLDSLTVEVYPGDDEGDLRSVTTTVQATLKEIVSTAVEAAAAAGQIRFSAQMRSIEIPEGPPES